MKRAAIALVVIVVFMCPSVFAEIMPCEKLKGEIDAKLQAKGVKAFSLEIVAADQVKDQKVVGSCDGGTKKIVYTKQGSK